LNQREVTLVCIVHVDGQLCDAVGGERASFTCGPAEGKSDGQNEPLFGFTPVGCL